MEDYEDDYKCLHCRFFDKKTRHCNYWEPGCVVDDDEPEAEADIYTEEEDEE